MLVPYAGMDPYEAPIGEPPPRRPKQMIAYEYFQLGWGTDRIAERLNITEATALRYISLERSRMLCKPSPYQENAA